MRLYGAIDLHSNNNVTVVTDEQDHVVYEKRLPNDLALITQASQLPRFTRRYRQESTYNWYWLINGLMDQAIKFTWPIPPPFNSTKD
jgi:transposase